jgi:murein L,D-transpeptidase YcbB/YkuD
MKNVMCAIALFALVPMVAQADVVDVIGGADSSTQTIHHCGFLPTVAGKYTDSPITTEIVRNQLAALGYHIAPTKAVVKQAHRKRSAKAALRAAQRAEKQAKKRAEQALKKAVRSFQRDEGLKADGVVGAQTAQRLAFAGHPSPNVKRCYRNAVTLR